MSNFLNLTRSNLAPYHPNPLSPTARVVYPSTPTYAPYQVTPTYAPYQVTPVSQVTQFTPSYQVTPTDQVYQPYPDQVYQPYPDQVTPTDQVYQPNQVNQAYYQRPGTCQMSDNLCVRTEAQFKRFDNKARILPGIGLPSQNNGVCTIIHGIGVNGRNSNSNSKSVLANVALFSRECNRNRYLTLDQIVSPLRYPYGY